MVVMQQEATRLRQVRERLGVTQEDVVRRTRTLRVRTYIRAESGRTRVTLDTANQILEAVNRIATEKGLSPFKLEDLGLTIY